MIPSFDQNYIEKLDKVPGLHKTPTGLNEQLRIMEELGNSMRETPISIMESESITLLTGGRGLNYDAT